MPKIRIAHLAGPNATITNAPPLVTSNKARAKHGLPPMADVDGEPSRFDVLRTQRLAKPVTVYVERHSAHPLEADADDLYARPDGWLDETGAFSREPVPGGKAVYEVELRPEDGLYPLPYMARQADGSPWEGDGVTERAPRERSRQPFFPDGSRLFEEIDRLGVDGGGRGSVVANRAAVDFYRLAPSAGYATGLEAGARPDRGTGDIPPEQPGYDYFAYRPPHLSMSPSRAMLARITNAAQAILSSGSYDGAIWTQGSPRIEETMYWFHLALDTTVPICGNASQRYHGQISSDGQKNVADTVDYLGSRVWADADGRNRCGAVMCQDQRIYAARDVAKVDARPGGYVATGGHGGILGAAGGGTGTVLRYLPATKHTWHSEVNVTRLPETVSGLAGEGFSARHVPVRVKGERGEIMESAIPKVSVVKDVSYHEDDFDGDPMQEVDVLALIARKLSTAPLSGFVLEGLNPYGKAASSSRNRILAIAAHLGFPVVNVGRGNTEGFSIGGGPVIRGSNLTATKAVVLLRLCIMKFGMLPPAADPMRPTAEEVSATMRGIEDYQAIFDTH